MSNLLVLGGFPDQRLRCLRGSTFIYLQVRELAKYFDKVYVISHRVWLPGLLRWIPYMPADIRDRLEFLDYSEGNIEVFFPKYSPWLQGKSPQEFWPYHVHMVRRIVANKDLKFDIIHGFFSVPMGATAATIAHETGVPSVLTVEENDEWFRSAVKCRHPAYMRSWLETNRIVVVNRQYIDLLANVGVPRERISYIPNGFDAKLTPRETKTSLRKRLGLTPDEFVFVNVAFIEPKKDHRTLVEAFRQLRASGRNARLFIIGNGPLMKQVSSQISELGLNQDIRLLGSLTPQQVLEWNTVADACVNYSKAEGNPTVLFEALGCGRPYIGSDVGGVKDIVTDESLGLIAECGNSERLHSLLVTAMERSWNEDYIRRVSLQYSWQRIAERVYHEVYEGILKKDV